MAGRYELQVLPARCLALDGWSPADGRCGASRSCSQECGVHVVPRGKDHRKIGSFGDGDGLRCVSRDSDSGRHDAGEPFNAEAEDMLRVPSGIGVFAGARPRGERPVRGLPRCAQQRSEDAAAGGSTFAAPQAAVNSLPRFSQSSIIDREIPWFVSRRCGNSCGIETCCCGNRSTGLGSVGIFHVCGEDEDRETTRNT